MCVLDDNACVRVNMTVLEAVWCTVLPSCETMVVYIGDTCWPMYHFIVDSTCTRTRGQHAPLSPDVFRVNINAAVTFCEHVGLGKMVTV